MSNKVQLVLHTYVAAGRQRHTCVVPEAVIQFMCSWWWAKISLKHVQQPRNNKLSYTVASCWSFSYIIIQQVLDFRLPLWCKQDFGFSGTLCSVDCQLVTDVSGQPVGSILEGPADFSWTAPTFKMGPTGWHVKSVNTNLRQATSQKNQNLKFQ